MILAARQEHELYVPDEKTEETKGPLKPALQYEDSKVGAILRECLDLGGKGSDRKQSGEVGRVCAWQSQALAGRSQEVGQSIQPLTEVYRATKKPGILNPYH